ncbi:MAG: mechanosensitive ion channel family protein, partial [Lachnospiraceae bacterium]|nr:mechanosensitive ion channel family protein [Lachnospiraceae bacterium]
MQSKASELLSWIMNKTISVLLALLVLWIGIKVAKWLLKLVQRSFDKSKMDPTVSSFLLSLIR